MSVPPQESVHLSKDPLLGVTLAGARIEAVLGEGAAARVYRASRLADGRPFAVKVLTDARRRGLQERFRREARALRRICHPNVVAVFDSGTTPDGRPYLMMELLSGRTLAQTLESAGSLPGTRIKALTLQILSGLAAAHARGLVHRDLKPSNLMLIGGQHGERVKILDFGVVRTTDAQAATALTKSEVLLGTPRYMSPEQVMSPNQAGPSADLYALGIILYELLTGRAPFSGQVVELIEAQLHHPPPPLLTQTGLEPLVLSLLAKDPKDRPASAEAVRAQLEGLEVVDGLAPSLSLLNQAVGRRGPLLKRAPGVVLRRNEQADEDRGERLRGDSTVHDGALGGSLETLLDGQATLLAEPATVWPLTAQGEQAPATLFEGTESDGTIPDDEPLPTRIVPPEPVVRARPMVVAPAPMARRSVWHPTPLQIGLLVAACFLVSAIVGYASQL